MAENKSIKFNVKSKKIYTDNSDITLINGDCLEVMESIDNKSINCIITDLPWCF